MCKNERKATIKVYNINLNNYIMLQGLGLVEKLSFDIHVRMYMKQLSIVPNMDVYP